MDAVVARREQGADTPIVFVPVSFGNQEVRWPSDRLGPRPAEQPLGGGIPSGDDTFVVQGNACVEGVVHIHVWGYGRSKRPANERSSGWPVLAQARGVDRAGPAGPVCGLLCRCGKLAIFLMPL